jgi:preprotein translocase subunit SecA
MQINETIQQLPLIRDIYRRRVLALIQEKGKSLQHASETDLRRQCSELRFRAQSGEKPAKLIAEAFALIRETSHRVLGMKHFDVQLSAGISLASKCIVEMATGEGKTLTAMLPLFLHGLYGKGAHLATANDYLARRDAEITQPVFAALGLSVGVVQKDISDADRFQAYRCDLTYGTCTEFGFDFLRDRMKRRGAKIAGLKDNDIEREPALQPVRRPMHFILVDEADSIMIDDAGTPLIIGAASSKHRERVIRLYQWAAEHSGEARERKEFKYIEHQKQVELTETGRTWVREVGRQTQMSDIPVVDLYEYMERAIRVRRDYRRDRNFIVSDHKVTIVDNNTGRLAVGRHWQDGIHQAIEAQEGLPITVPTGSAAQLTIQSLILSYPKRAGMTGTAWSSRREFRKVYKMPVVCIPTRLPSQRKQWPTQYYPSELDKMMAIRDEVLALRMAGRSVLIGSRSVVKSELLSNIFNDAGIPHDVLNARYEDREAEIVAQAGQPGKVTISTSMAGRGTDIKLNDSVRERGGLHVILCELNDSARVDRQLIGRCGRQGDPGSFRFFISPDDHLMDPKNRTEFWAKMLRFGSVVNPVCWFLGAQRTVNGKNMRDRLAMLHFEKKRLRTLKQAGLDPVLDVVG